MSRLSRRPNGRFAELPVGRTQAYVLARSQAPLRFLHSALPADSRWPEDPSHSEIVGVPSTGALKASTVGDRLAECVTATHPAVE